MCGSSSWMPYASQEVKGLDDDDDDEHSCIESCDLYPSHIQVICIVLHEHYFHKTVCKVLCL
jgi:hypothetical protein